VFDDDAGPGVVVPGGLGAAELSSGGKALGYHLVRYPALQDPLAPGIVGGVEPAQQLLEVTMGIAGDAEHLPPDEAIETFHHSIV
jgi:hypothetical protein